MLFEELNGAPRDIWLRFFTLKDGGEEFDEVLDSPLLSVEVAELVGAAFSTRIRVVLFGVEFVLVFESALSDDGPFVV